MHHKIVIGLPDDVTVGAWEELLKRSEFASCYTSPYFLSVPFFAKQNPFAVLVFDRGEAVAVATGTANKKAVECGNPASPQILIHHDCDMEAAAASLADGLSIFCPSETISAYCRHSSLGFKASGFRERVYQSPLAPRMIKLQREAESIFKGFSATARNEVRKAIKIGVLVSELDLQKDFDEYYQMYVTWCGYKHLSPQPADTLRASLSQSSNRLVLAARHDGRIVAVSSFTHYSPGLVEYAANASRYEDRKLRPNGLLVWRAIEWAAEREFNWFSMGGDHFFLSQFGGSVLPTHCYRKDLTVFRRHDLREWAHSVAVKSYQRIPRSLRTRLDMALRRGRAES